MNDSTQNTYFLGIDAGATKTHAVVIDSHRRMIGSGKVPPGNFHNVGIEAALQQVSSAAALAINQAQEQLSQEISISQTALGIAGLDTPNDSDLIKSYVENNLSNLNQTFSGSKRLTIVSDALVGLYSGVDSDHGVCIIAGTGANVYGLTHDGQEARAGDWGYLLGDQASGYAMGLALLRLVMQEFDGRSPRSILTNKVLALLELETPFDLVEWAYQDKAPVEEIARVSQLCIADEVWDLPKVQAITAQAVDQAIKAYSAVINRLELRLLPNFPVVLVGGIMMHHESFRGQLTQKIIETTPQAIVTLPQRPPAEGAAFMLQSDYFGGQLPQSTIVIE